MAPGPPAVLSEAETRNGPRGPWGKAKTKECLDAECVARERFVLDGGGGHGCRHRGWDGHGKVCEFWDEM